MVALSNTYDVQHLLYKSYAKYFSEKYFITYSSLKESTINTVT